MQSYVCGNKPGKLLASQIKEYHSKTHIPFLYHPTIKQKLTDPQAIANAFSIFYSNLYNLKDDKLTTQPDNSSIQKFLDSVQLPKLSDAQLITLNAPFTSSEIGKAIDTLSNNKAPRPDGFVGEYYKQFKTLLIEHITPMFNEAASSASFPQEMLRALIITLLKPGK